MAFCMASSAATSAASEEELSAAVAPSFTTNRSDREPFEARAPHGAEHVGAGGERHASASASELGPGFARRAVGHTVFAGRTEQETLEGDVCFGLGLARAGRVKKQETEAPSASRAKRVEVTLR